MESTTDNAANQPTDAENQPSDETQPVETDTQPTDAADQTEPTDESQQEESAPDESPQDATDAAEQTEQTDESPQDVEASRAQSAAVVEAILFATDSPISAGKMSTVAELPQRVIKQAIAALNERYEANSASVRIEELAGGFQLLTQSQFHDVLSRLLRVKSESRLSQAALETLAIVAYRQPILRADIEAIRGVACGEMLRGLMEKNLVKIVGRADVLGRPMLYGTTKLFLEVFGLSGLDDLPRVDELRTAASQVITNPAQPTEGEDSEAANGEAEQTDAADAEGAQTEADATAATEAAKGGVDGASETVEQTADATQGDGDDEKVGLADESASSQRDRPQPTASDDDPDADDEDEFDDDDDWDDDDD